MPDPATWLRHLANAREAVARADWMRAAKGGVK